jgi:ligand-binding sensor domain-containing protein
LVTAGLAAAALGLWGLAVVRQALGRLEQARAHAGARDAVGFERERLDPLRRDGVRLFQATKSARAVARFKDSYFAATDGGLAELSPSGRVARRFSVLDGLGESDLTCLAAYGGRLYIGTRSRGLLAFDGEGFERYWWPDHDSKTITALSADQGKLLVGTLAGGLLEFDGEGFREVRAGEGGARLEAVTVIARYGPRLYFGTFSRGLWVSEGGRWAHFDSADGLMSDRVVGVVESGGEVLAASDFGLAAAPADGLVLGAEAAARPAWRAAATIPSLSGAVNFNGQVVLCKDDGEVAAPKAPPGGPRGMREGEVIWGKTGAAQTWARLSVSDGYLWLLGSGGVRRSVAAPAAGGAVKGPGQITFAEFGADESPQSPETNLISALSFDAGGRLWVGSFRNGVDVFAPNGLRLAHLESDDLREINALVPEGQGGVLAATSRGIVRLDSALRPARLNTQGVPAVGSVLHVGLLKKGGESGAPPNSAKTPPGEQILVATPRGLSLGTPDNLRVLTTVQGLPSNSVYSVWSGAGRVYAGTLGGLAEISSGRVVRVFKDSNSALANNWVTAVCGAGGRLFVGTYGGGVFELLPSGELRGFASETGRAFVNQNAMWGDAERLYVGTLDGALVFDLRSQKWTRLREGLPSPVVLSVTGRDRSVYFGTTSGLARFDASFFDSAD